MENKNIIKLKEIRKAKGISQVTLARALNVNDVTVCRWETGKTEPSISNMIRICALLNISADELLGIKEFNA